jgi:hypothetical protein
MFKQRAYPNQKTSLGSRSAMKHQLHHCRRLPRSRMLGEKDIGERMKLRQQENIEDEIFCSLEDQSMDTDAFASPLFEGGSNVIEST